MSDTATRRRIRAQASPRDPLVMRFILDAAIEDGRAARFDRPERGEAGGPECEAPLARALFAIPAVGKVRVTGETILVTATPGSDWGALKAPVAAAIRAALDAPEPPLGPPPPEGSAAERDAALLEAVNAVLDSRANPSIAAHGGHITAEGASDGTVYLRMSGGCQGCSSSAATLRQGVETILRAALPDIREIVDVTDHAQGQTPYYTDAPGQSPLLNRPVPPEALRWEEGEVAIDPAYLGPRLGLRPDQLRGALARGEVTMDSAPGPADGVTRVVVRSARRAWAADVRPDGRAQEVPPPRAPERGTAPVPLARQVRNYLEGLPSDSPPLTYGTLARALGLHRPGSVRRITAALEETMAEDAEAGRPFLAARVISRGTAGLPAKGFFQHARALGHGPRPGESDQAFHLRHLTALAGQG